jgi:hypothetical protein
MGYLVDKQHARVKMKRAALICFILVAVQTGLYLILYRPDFVTRIFYQTAETDATDQSRLVKGGATSRVTDSSTTTGIARQMTLNGASPNQEVNCQFGNSASNFMQGGGSCALTDRSGATFIASISGTTMNVRAVSAGTLAPNLYVRGTGVNTETRITAYGTGTGGVGTYTVSPSQSVDTESMHAYTYAVAIGAGVAARAVGNSAYSVAGRADLYVNGTAIGAELDSANWSGPPAADAFGSGLLPPPIDFGQPYNNTIGLLLAAQGTFQSSLAILVAGGRGTQTYQDGIYIEPEAATDRALFIDANPSSGAKIGAYIRTGQTGAPLQVQAMGSPASGLSLITGYGPSGNAIFFMREDGDVGNPKATLSGSGAVIAAKGVPFAPGTGFGELMWVTGSKRGTCRLVALAGTSTEPTTIVDNVGDGC